MPTTTRLPPPPFPGSVSVEQALGRRRSARAFGAAPLTLAELSRLLWAAQGVTDEAGRRTTPSAGARYPLRVYVLAGAVTALPCGLYAYAPRAHALEALRGEDLRAALCGAAIDHPPWLRESAAVLVVTADCAGMDAHFAAQPPRGTRGTRYAWIETGALAGNVYLQAAGLDLAVVLVGGFDDEGVMAALGLPPQPAPTALLCIGRA